MISEKVFDISVSAKERNKHFYKEDLAKGRSDTARCRCCNKENSADFYFVISRTTRFWLCADCVDVLLCAAKKESERK